MNHVFEVVTTETIIHNCNNVSCNFKCDHCGKQIKRRDIYFIKYDTSGSRLGCYCVACDPITKNIVRKCSGEDCLYCDGLDSEPDDWEEGGEKYAVSL